MRPYDLLQHPAMGRVVRSRWPQLVAMLITLAGLVVAMVAGVAGTPVGARNVGIVGVWIGWWALLMLVAVPLAGRAWCGVCPVPVVGEWLQRGAVLGPPHGRGIGLGRRWPRALRHIWLQNVGFALVALFSLAVLTRPSVTAMLLLAFVAAAIGVSVIFERRTFCRFLCPMGGFIGLYSQLAPVELRVKDVSICANHREKTCYTGNADGYGCPWQVFPPGLTKNINCGLCFECVRACPHDNIALQIRTPGADLSVWRGRRMDEAFKVCILLGSAVVYSAVMLGPWGRLKSAAYDIGSVAWFVYALGFLLTVFALVPGLLLLAVFAGRRLARSRVPLRRSFIDFAQALIPLGLAAWVAFSLSFVFANVSYLWPMMSDPMGWGWDLLGTAGMAWQPYATGIIPRLQIVILLAGLGWASVTVRRIASETAAGVAVIRQALPIMTFCFAITTVLLLLLVA